MRPNRDPSVLVDPVQFMETPERAGGKWSPCRSIVWLNRFDIRDCGERESMRLPVEPFPRFSIKRIGEHWKRAVFGISSGPMADEGPNGLIERSPQALEIVPADQINRHMGLLDPDAVSDLIPFRFLIGSDGIGISTEFADLHPEIIQVTLRPVGLTASIS
jgi:hypothetical protein